IASVARGHDHREARVPVRYRRAWSRPLDGKRASWFGLLCGEHPVAMNRLLQDADIRETGCAQLVGEAELLWTAVVILGGRSKMFDGNCVDDSLNEAVLQCCSPPPDLNSPCHPQVLRQW